MVAVGAWGSLVLPSEAQSPNKGSWDKVAHYKQDVLAEISGLAPSLRRENVYWAHNDSGGRAEIHALDLDGRFLGSVAVPRLKNVDWEDMASFSFNGKSYLLIADVGDNGRKRERVAVHLIEEPSPDRDGSYHGLTAKPAWSVTFRYIDGPQDCEAVAVDPTTERIFLLNKDSKASIVYEVPLRGDGEDLIAKRTAVLQKVNNAAGNLAAFFKAGLLGTRATAMDVSADGRMAAALTYTDVRLYPREPNQSWTEAFQGRPHVIPLPSVYQPEALCFSRDNLRLYVSSEESPTPIVAYSLNQLAARP